MNSSCPATDAEEGERFDVRKTIIRAGSGLAVGEAPQHMPGLVTDAAMNNLHGNGAGHVEAERHGAEQEAEGTEGVARGRDAG
eukprot:scaffold222107_cov27-Tisochrysis_lutea.AAC.1